jgi:hypothetical protein
MLNSLSQLQELDLQFNIESAGRKGIRLFILPLKLY